MKKLKKKTMLRADKMKKCYWTTAGVAVLCLCCATPAMAAGSDPLDIVNNLSDFIFSIIKALGVIILGWGIVQVGMSIQSHDASQRTQGFLCLHPLSNKEQRVQLHSLWCDFSKQNVDVVLTGVDDTANRNDFRFNAVERDIAFDHQHTQVSFIAGLCPNGNAHFRELLELGAAVEDDFCDPVCSGGVMNLTFDIPFYFLKVA